MRSKPLKSLGLIPSLSKDEAGIFVFGAMRIHSGNRACEAAAPQSDDLLSLLCLLGMAHRLALQ
jgi:hypothetical protein